MWKMYGRNCAMSVVMLLFVFIAAYIPAKVYQAIGVITCFAVAILWWTYSDWKEEQKDGQRKTEED